MVQRSWFQQNGLFYTILALVLLIHLILMAVRIYQNLDLARLEPEATSPPIKIRVIPSDQFERKRQIVQSDDPDTFSKPKDSAYLSDKDRSFDRQSVARNIDKFNKGGKGTSAKPKQDLSLSDLGANKKGYHPLQEAAVAKKTSKSEQGTPTAHTDGRGVSSTNDFVEGVPLGDLTYLNTVEYKYYGFYLRIKQKLEQFWGRSIQEKAEDIFKEGRKIATEENLITSLIVTLDAAGEIINVAIKGTSGVKELDDAAVESFNEAGPFPNPPKGLVQNGKVEIEWGFVVNT